jgi:hypothetical protein
VWIANSQGHTSLSAADPVRSRRPIVMRLPRTDGGFRDDLRARITNVLVIDHSVRVA